MMQLADLAQLARVLQTGKKRLVPVQYFNSSLHTLLEVALESTLWHEQNEAQARPQLIQAGDLRFWLVPESWYGRVVPAAPQFTVSSLRALGKQLKHQLVGASCAGCDNC